MPFKTILAVLAGGDMSKDMQRALELAAEVDAHLSVVALQVAMSPTLSDYPVDTDWLDRRRGHHQVFKAGSEAQEARCNASGISYEFSTFYDEPLFLTEELTRRSLYADLILLGGDAMKDDELRRIVVSGALFDAMRPVFLLPPDKAVTLRPKRIVVGWNDKVEAARAVRETLDLLKDADTVHVTMVDPQSPYGDNDGEPGAEVAAYLARHGVNVSVDQMPSGGRDVADVINQHAADVSADMTVLGAYGHSRLRQRVFGGVTSSVLRQVQLPTLLAR